MLHREGDPCSVRPVADDGYSLMCFPRDCLLRILSETVSPPPVFYVIGRAVGSRVGRHSQSFPCW